MSEVLGYTSRYQPTGKRFTIPGLSSVLGGTYSYGYSYNVDGSLFGTGMSAVGDVPAEVLKQNYNALGLPSSLKTSPSSTGDDVFLVNGISYTGFGEVALIGAEQGPAVEGIHHGGYIYQ